MRVEQSGQARAEQSHRYSKLQESFLSSHGFSLLTFLASSLGWEDPGKDTRQPTNRVLSVARADLDRAM
ncbi:hypothetical protein KTAU_39190 [Thermogemmatispora aurantia]|uniref:Uncharacterized protein n=1 Tax=Thermogemmatispora aurantia TaxID=2045279 RepID=A0A5J4K9L0_9CHLR|nr:hypothetical protein KTAU_39190 [Thermogemmatispora aurantia]